MTNSDKSENFLFRFFKPTEKESAYLHKREVAVVFLIGYLIALILWLFVNLGRDYNLTVEVKLNITEPNKELVFSEMPPQYAKVEVNGIGWKLLPIYRTPPEIHIPYEEERVNVAEIVRRKIGKFSDLTVDKVEPDFVTLKTESQKTKKVPVLPDLDIRLKPQYKIYRQVRVLPDSVKITGPESIIEEIEEWSTERLRLRDVNSNISQHVSLLSSDRIRLPETKEVLITFELTEITEGEVRIYVKARNVPDNKKIRFNPSIINVRYDVPIEYFSEAQEIIPYEAYVDYEIMKEDSTGFVVPTVRPVTEELNLVLRSFQPRRVSYFRVIDE